MEHVIWKGIVLSLSFIFMLKLTDGLYCYSCSGTTSNASCVTDITGLVSTRFKYNGPYSKDCDLEINQTMCVLETTEGEGDLKTIIRGCSDGFTFSFTDVKLFRHLSPTNQTQCAVYMGQMICVTLCRLDYCNGPQDIPTKTSSTARTDRQDFLWLVVTVYFLFIS